MQARTKVTSVSAGEAKSATSLATAVHAKLRADILKGRLKPLERLRFEELRKAYDVGLSPLREALSRLAVEGLVVAESQRGYKVAPISIEDLNDLANVRCELECFALRLAIENGDDEWEADVVRSYHYLSLVNRWSPADRNEINAEWVTRHNVFHDSLVAASGSPRLVNFRRMLCDQYDRYLRMSASYGAIKRDDRGEHKALMELALARDVEGACTAMRAHIDRTVEMVLEIQESLSR
jgi:GntR family carbon starvation induced transcriptional regulator